MKILHVTDFHFNKRWFEWLSAEAPQYDIVCFTGDLLDLFATERDLRCDSRPSRLTRALRPIRRTNVREQIKWVRGWLMSWPAQTPLCLCSGNHDYWPSPAHFIDTDAEAGWMKKCRRPGGIWCDEGVLQCVRDHQVLNVPWAQVPDVPIGRPVIALVHAPPSGSEISSSGPQDFDGDRAIATAVRKLPQGSIVLCGHVHRPAHWYARIETEKGQAIWGFNPGVAAPSQDRPNFIVLDLDGLSAHFHSDADHRTCRLD